MAIHGPPSTNASHYAGRLAANMTQAIQYLSSVEQIMDARTATIDPQRSAADARSLMDDAGGLPVPVVDERRNFVGVLTADDLFMDGPAVVGQMARRPRMTVAPHESAYSVISRMIARRIDWVPVVRGRKFVGALTRNGVLAAFGESGTA